jgi:hypothetical protein
LKGLLEGLAGEVNGFQLIIGQIVVAHGISHEQPQDVSNAAE